MGLIRRLPAVAGNPLLPALLLLPVLLAVGYSLYQQHTAARWNRVISSPALLQDSDSSAPVEVQLARAAALEDKGDMESALNLYKRLEELPGNPYARSASYDAATLYLRRALKAGGPASDPQTIPLVELAKEGYRNLLRQDPMAWDARYNLDRALRLLPEPDDDDNGAGNPPIGAERAPTTMRGFTLGLP